MSAFIYCNIPRQYILKSFIINFSNQLYLHLLVTKINGKQYKNFKKSMYRMLSTLRDHPALGHTPIEIRTSSQSTTTARGNYLRSWFT